MIARISGQVIEVEEKALIVDVQGLGYRVVVGRLVLGKVRTGDTVNLRTYHHIKEDGQDLFGFEEEREEQYFKLLLTVPSVGARTARNILDVAPPELLEQAVADDDVAILTKVSGVGKRTAERIIVELKEKLQAPTKRRAGGALQQEVIEALQSIGFSGAEARKVVAQLPDDISSVEEAVKLSLRKQGAR